MQIYLPPKIRLNTDNYIECELIFSCSNRNDGHSLFTRVVIAWILRNPERGAALSTIAAS